MKAFDKLILALIVALVINGLVYAAFSRRLITAMYERRSLPILNERIRRPETIPLSDYLDKAARLEWDITFWSLLALCVILVLRQLRRKKYLGAAIINLLIVCCLYEVGTKWVINRPALIKRMPAGLVWHFRQIYSTERRILALRKNLRYDPQLSYTLKPGVFKISEREFTNRYFINSLGVRDDEESLNAPEIIVLGDSHAMGFGVNQNEPFAQVLEQKTGYKVLNAGISSYGTVREAAFLERMQTRNLRYLIIQYCTNDLNENKRFYEDHFLKIMSPESFQRLVAVQARLQRYYPGRYTVMLLAGFLRRIEAGKDYLYAVWHARHDREYPVSGGYAARLFLNALHKNMPVDLTGVQVIVIAMNAFIESDTPFITALNRLKLGEQYPDYIRNLEAIQLSSKLEPSQYGYVLDDHITKEGHAVIAEEILKVLKRLD